MCTKYPLYGMVIVVYRMEFDKTVVLYLEYSHTTHLKGGGVTGMRSLGNGRGKCILSKRKCL